MLVPRLKHCFAQDGWHVSEGFSKLVCVIMATRFLNAPNFAIDIFSKCMKKNKKI